MSEQDQFRSMENKQDLRRVGRMLGDIVSYLREGKQIPRDVMSSANDMWTQLDLHAASGSDQNALTLEGEGNLLRELLYKIEHGEPVDEQTIATAEKWARDSSELPAPPTPMPPGAHPGYTHVEGNHVVES